jgi:serine/threonine protein kinase
MDSNKTEQLYYISSLSNKSMFNQGHLQAWNHLRLELVTNGVVEKLQEAARLNKNIMPIVKTCTDTNGRVEIFYKYIPNPVTVLGWLKRNPEKLNDLDFVRRLIVIVCNAITTLHALDVIHRDIHPTNIFINDESSDISDLVIGDLELATLAGTLDGTNGVPWGTPGFIAPEYYIKRTLLPYRDVNEEIDLEGLLLHREDLGELGRKPIDNILATDDPFLVPVEPQRDIYALAKTLLILLSDTPEGEETTHLVLQVTSGERNSQEVINGSIKSRYGESFTTVISKALSKDLEYRYSTVVDFKNDLINSLVKQKLKQKIDSTPEERKQVLQNAIDFAKCIPAMQHINLTVDSLITHGLPNLQKKIIQTEITRTYNANIASIILEALSCDSTYSLTYYRMSLEDELVRLSSIEQ